MNKEEVMQKINFAKSKVKTGSVTNAKKDIKNFQKNIERVMEENGFSTVKEATDFIEEKYKNIFFYNKGVNVSNGNISIADDTSRSDYYMFKSTSYIRTHPEKIWEMLDKMSVQERRDLIQNREKGFIRYTSDMQANYNTILKDISGYVLDYLKISRNDFIEGKLDYKQRVNFQKGMLSIISTKSRQLDTELKTSYIRRITRMAKLLDENGSFKDGVSRYNSVMRQIGLPELQTEYEKSKGGNKPQFTTFSDLKNTPVVEKLPMEKLIGISAFLSNRLSKEYFSYKESKFVLGQLNMLDNIANQNIPPIDDEELRETLGKFEYLKDVSRELYTQNSENIQRKLKAEDRSIDDSFFVTEFDLSDRVQEAEAYKEYYDGVLPNANNDFFDNINAYNSDLNIFEVIYNRKDFDFAALVTTLLDRGKQLNWGYIPEVENGRNSIERNKRMILLGVDFDNFNFPIRLHCSKKDIKQLVNEYTGTDEIPVYKGDEDWTVETLYNDSIQMTAQSIFNFDKHKRKFVKDTLQAMKPGDRNYEYLSHLNWMMNPNMVPERFKKDEVVSLTTGEVKEANQRNRDE